MIMVWLLLSFIGQGATTTDSSVAQCEVWCSERSNEHASFCKCRYSEAGTAFAIVCVLSAAGILLFCCAKVRPSSYK